MIRGIKSGKEKRDRNAKKDLLKEKKEEEKKRKKEKRGKVFFFKQKTAYEIKECDWSSDVCSSDLSCEKL